MQLGGTTATPPGGWPWILREFGTLIPPFPGPDVVAPVVVPRPLELPDDTSQDALLLVRVFANTARKRWPTSSGWWTRSGNLPVRAERERAVLTECAGLLREKQVPPYCWAVFVLRWQSTCNPDTPLPMNLFWRPKTVHAHRMWARHNTHHLGGQLWFSDSLKVYYTRWLRVQSELVRLLGQNALHYGAVVTCVAGVFDEQAPVTLLEYARAEHQSMQAKLDASAARWDCLWEV